MGIMTLPAKLTADDLATMPPDGSRYEVIDGVLTVDFAPIPRHQQASFEFAVELRGVASATNAGEVYPAPTDVRLSPETQVQPDILFVRRERLHIISDKRVEGAPDLVVEVLSPSTRAIDTTRKAELYARFGVREYWLLDPEQRTIAAFRLVDSQYVAVAPDADGALRSTVLRGFVVIPTEFFLKVR